MSGKLITALAVFALTFFAVQQLMNNTQITTQESDLRSLWSSWKVQYDKSYSTQQEDDLRFGIFCENYAKIMAHNAEGHTFFMVVNKFADLTGEEFKATYASCAGGQGLGDDYCPSANNCPTLPTVNFTAMNWTKSGAVTPVKNQGQCGSCWAFSTTGSLEALYYINKTILVSFSEQQLVDCASQCQACDGCWPYLAMEYTATNGIEPEKIYPYTGVQGTCKYNKAVALNANTGYQCVTQKSNDQLMAALAIQPVSVAVEADQASWQFYGGGIVSALCGDRLDHAVLLTGYGPHKGTGANAWYVKNSWGGDWGDQGYIWISDSSSPNSGFGVCGILRCGTLPINPIS